MKRFRKAVWDDEEKNTNITKKELNDLIQQYRSRALIYSLGALAGLLGLFLLNITGIWEFLRVILGSVFFGVFIWLSIVLPLYLNLRFIWVYFSLVSTRYNLDLAVKIISRCGQGITSEQILQLGYPKGISFSTVKMLKILNLIRTKYKAVNTYVLNDKDESLI